MSADVDRGVQPRSSLARCVGHVMRQAHPSCVHGVCVMWVALAHFFTCHSSIIVSTHSLLAPA
eukprot:13813082-Alexandrium_andersonii.AAC.1